MGTRSKSVAGAGYRLAMRGMGLRLVPLAVAVGLLAACQPDSESSAPEIRPVRTVTVVKRESGETVVYTGRIQAENETRLAFRIPGRMIERSANVGDRVRPGQVVAKIGRASCRERV